MTFADLPGLMTRLTGDEKHSQSATSTLDVIWVLYDRILNITPEDPNAGERDRFLLSKGHGPMAYYAVLAAKGFVAVDDLSRFGTYDSPLGQHPDRTLIPGVEISSGSLGHGLPIAVGRALGLRARGSHARVFCLLGDAELDEGSNHEAIAVAARLGLSSITAIVINNQSASHGWPGSIQSRFEIEGWSGIEVDGRNHLELEEALQTRPGTPNVVVARVEPKQ